VKYPLIIVVTIFVSFIYLVPVSASTTNPNLFYYSDVSIFDDTSDDYANFEIYSPTTDDPNQAAKAYMKRNDLRVRAYDYRIEKSQEDTLLKKTVSDEYVSDFPENYEEYAKPTSENPSPYENIFDIWEGH
jgi:hypothetical protein